MELGNLKIGTIEGFIMKYDVKEKCVYKNIVFLNQMYQIMRKNIRLMHCIKMYLCLNVLRICLQNVIEKRGKGKIYIMRNHVKFMVLY